MSDDPFKPIAAGNTAPTARPQWRAITPVPADAPAPPAGHPKRGAPSATWEYRDKAGALLQMVARFDDAEGKAILPITFCQRDDDTGAREWRWQALPEARPLYRLAALAADDRPVLVVEGEKAADAAAKLLPTYAVTTSSGGSKAAGKANWLPLAGRRIVIWPDADAAGAAYAEQVAKHARSAGATEVSIVVPPAGVDEGWDAADAAIEGWTESRAQALLASAVSPAAAAAEPPPAQKEEAKRSRVPQRDQLIGFTEFCELWHDPSGEPFITMPVNSHRENWPIRSTRVRRWLANRFHEETDGTLGSQALEDGLRVLEARAGNLGPECATWLRVARSGQRLYVDLGDAKWRAIEIDAEGWRIVTDPPVKFLRSPAMRPLPEPEGGGLIEELRTFINAGDGDFALILSWLVGAFREVGPYPILVLNGEQGSGKSGVSRLLRSLVDPAAAAIRAAPRDDRDLVVSAVNSWVLALDNLSSVPAWLSDALCRLATGSGFATRMLHTDREEMIFEASRPIILNGIPLLAERPDLADRAITVHLPAISEASRRPEDEFWRDFETAKPRILGALLDAVSTALRKLPDTKLATSPRLADFAKWITAAESGLGWEPGHFLSVYGANRKEVSESAFEADPVATAIKTFVERSHPLGWHGSATELLNAINDSTTESVRRSKVWPQTAQALGNRIERIAPLLRGKGFAIDRRHSGTRTISIVPPTPAA